MRWLLPEHIEDILPAEAMRIEMLRRSILDLFFKNRFELVMPPLVEFTDSLLTGTGHDLELRTFKWGTTLGEMMGVRADITPQVARTTPTCSTEGRERLCYCAACCTAAKKPRRNARTDPDRRRESTARRIQSDLEIRPAGRRSQRRRQGRAQGRGARPCSLVVQAARPGHEWTELFEACRRRPAFAQV